MKNLSHIIKCIFLTLVLATNAHAQNAAPIAVSQSLNLYQDTLYNGQFSASDADEQALTYSITTQPSSGTLTLLDPVTGTYTYLPALGYTGPISFGFKANDGTDDSAEATISITVKSRIYYKEDFEDDDHGFTFSGGLWKITQNFPRNGSRALGYVQNETTGSTPNGDFAAGNNQGQVTSPSIFIPENARLNISAYYSGENGPTWDIFRVFVVSEGQENLILVSYNNFDDDFYKDFNLDFSAYANKTITLKFTFATGDAIANNFPGVRVDDIIVYVPPTGPASITVTGNNNNISNGDETPSTEDHTDFGTVNPSQSNSIKRTFTIANTGGETLNLSGTPRVQIAGDAGFSLTIPPNSTVAGGISTTFDVTFNPSTFGSKTAVVTIPNNDTTKNPFTFTIRGALPAPSPTVTVAPATGITGYEAVLHGTVNPNGVAANYYFEYSTEPTLTNPSTTATGSLSAGSSDEPVSLKATQLLPETKYFYRLVGSNDLGQDETEILSFTTSYPLASATTYTTADGIQGGGAMYRPLPGIINNEGRILFQAVGLNNTSTTGTVTGANDEWLMNDVTGTPLIIMREGDQLGSNSGHYLTGLFNHLLLGESGQSVVSEKLAGATTTRDLAYLSVNTPGEVDILSQEGDAAPGGGTLINSVGKPVMDGADRVYFQGNTSGIATNRATGVWYDNGTNLQALIRAGANLTPVTGDNAWLGKVSNIISAGGDGVAFVAALQANPLNTKQKTSTLRNQVILSVVPGTPSNSISIVARKGDSVNGANNVKINSFSALSRGSNGDHAYIGLLKTGVAGITKNNDQVLVSIVDGESTIIAREGTTVLASGLTPKSFGKFFVTSDGDVIFQAVLNGANAATDGILCYWSATTKSFTVLAREGNTAPDTGGLNYGTLQNISVSNNGNIALQCLLSNGKIGLFRDTGSGFRLVIKAGTGPDDRVMYLGTNRTIASLNIYSKNTGTGNGGGGMGSAINDAGDVFAVLSLGGTHYVARVFRGEFIPPPL